MTPDQMRLVRLSFAAVSKRKVEAGRTFYDRLFAMEPDLRPMFKSDMNVQHGKFIEMIGVIIGLLHDPSGLSQTLAQLAHRHRDYGVRDKDYDSVGEALLLTFADLLGDGFTPELKTAWRDLYAMVASAMKRWSPQTDKA
jgi:hemoglobin-like flavoprotein